MIVGASAGQVPLIKKAGELGYCIAVVDYNSNAVGVSLADKFYNVSTTDEDAVLKAAKDFKPDGITTMQTDMPMRSIARVNEELGLCGIDRTTAINATDKIAMLKCFKRFDLPSPDYFVIKSNLNKGKNKFSYPCILKPADNSASRGVSLVNSDAEFEAKYTYSKKFSHSGDVLVEEYMQGPEVSVEVLVWQENVSIISVTDKITTGAPYFVEMGHKEPSALPQNSVAEIEKLAADAVRAVGVRNGQGHVEIILTKEGPKLIELGARLGGDFITSDLVPLSTGVDMLKETLHIACGEIPDIGKKYLKGSAILFIKAKKGIIKKIEGINSALKIKGVKRIELFKNVGDKSVEIHNSLDRIGCVIAQSESAEGALEVCRNALEKIKVVVSDV